MSALSKTLGVASIAALIALGANGAWAQSSSVNSDRDMSRAGKEAADGMSRRAARFVRIFDTDGSGSVSLAEIGAEQKRMLAASDLDGDGLLSVAEFRRRGRLLRSLGAASLFDLLDVNGDQQVSAAEIAAPSGRWFKRYDANGDGAMAAEELPRPQFRRWWRHGRRH